MVGYGLQEIKNNLIKFVWIFFIWLIMSMYFTLQRSYMYFKDWSDFFLGDSEMITETVFLVLFWFSVTNRRNWTLEALESVFTEKNRIHLLDQYFERKLPAACLSQLISTLYRKRWKPKKKDWKGVLELRESLFNLLFLLFFSFFLSWNVFNFRKTIL